MIRARGTPLRRRRGAPLTRAPLSRAPLAAALLCALLGGCAGVPPRPSPSEPPPRRSLRIADADLDRAPRAVSTAEALRDLDDARYAFSQAYAGLDGRAPWPAPGAIARAERALRARATWQPDAFAELLRDLFAAPDGHLAFGYGGRAPLRLTAAPPWRPLSGPAHLPASAAIFPAAAATPVDAGPALSSAAPTPVAALPALSPAAATPVAALPAPSSAAPTPFTAGPDAPRLARRAPVELTRSRDGVPVLAVRTFDTAAAAALDTLPALAAGLWREPAFVVDLRGNAGGNYLFAERLALALTDAPLRRLDELEVISVAAAEGRANSVRRRLARGDVPDEARPRFLEHLAVLTRLADALRARNAPRAELETRGALVRGRAPGPLRGRAVFLVDRGCASACEMLLSLVRQIPGVVIAGQNTRGSMRIGELALFQLPRSGVTLTFGTRAYRDPLGDFTELRGFSPDVWLDGADPLEEAAALARRGRGQTGSARTVTRPGL